MLDNSFTFKRWLQRLAIGNLRTSKQPVKPKKRTNCRLEVEALESRLVPSTVFFDDFEGVPLPEMSAA
jgi:hypothetical protein